MSPTLASFTGSAVVGLVLAATRCHVAFADYDPIAGYTPVSDVIEHSEIDLDMGEVESGVDELTEAGLVSAYTAYAVGGNSEKTDSIRTIRGFSTSAQEKLTGEKWFDIYDDYWNDPAYADSFTTAACNGTGSFEDAELVARSEGCLKGAQYQNVWMYVIHELEDAIKDCNNGDLTANDGGPHAWDEGWAFYAGSLEGSTGEGDGQLIYALADKRCENFATCTGDDDGSDFTGTAAVNSRLLELFQSGQTKLLAEKCDEVEEIKEDIVSLMTVPLVQGMLRYFYKADPEGGNGADKEAAELWAFSAAALPRIDNCDSEVGLTIRANTDIAVTTAPMSDGYMNVKQELESVYECLGFTCEDIGGLLIDGSTSDYYEGFEPCNSGSDGDVPGWGIALIVIAAVGVVAIAGVAFIKRGKTSRAQAANDLGGFGDKGSSTL